MQKFFIKQDGDTILNGGALKRWLYRGQRPGRIAKFLNGFWGIVASSGVTSDLMETLEVTGRKSGRIVSFPVVIVFVDEQRYLVSMLGNKAQWVLNVRAAGGKAVLRSGGQEQIQLEEIPAEKRAPILKAYLQIAMGAQPHIPVHKDAPLAEFEKIAAEFPVFRLASARTMQPK